MNTDNRAVKYCGGCNPRYDRAALVRQLEERLGAPLPPAIAGVVYDELYVVCGCSARCAALESFRAHRVIVFDHMAGIETGEIPK